MPKDSVVTKEELAKWRSETVDLMNLLDSYVVKMKVELARPTPRVEKMKEVVDLMEELL